jgi:hypothetical protein
MTPATATDLTSFDDVEEPKVRYVVATGKFEPDAFTNIAGRDGRFRMTLRYHAGEWWDGDRCTAHTDRQRAEVKGLGCHQPPEETFEYTTTWRSSPTLRLGRGFCHLFQLKATCDDGGPPLVVVSLLPAGDRFAVRYLLGIDADGHPKFGVARAVPWLPGTEYALAVRVRPSATVGGLVTASVDGDEFRGCTGIELQRPGHAEYRPKWGFYRAITSDLPSGEEYVEHANVTAAQI